MKNRVQEDETRSPRTRFTRQLHCCNVVPFQVWVWHDMIRISISSISISTQWVTQVASTWWSQCVCCRCIEIGLYKPCIRPSNIVQPRVSTKTSQSLMLIQSLITERFSPGNGDIQQGESYPAMVRKTHFQEPWWWVKIASRCHNRRFDWGRVIWISPKVPSQLGVMVDKIQGNPFLMLDPSPKKSLVSFPDRSFESRNDSPSWFSFGVQEQMVSSLRDFPRILGCRWHR